MTALPLLLLPWLPKFSIPDEPEAEAKTTLQPPFLSLGTPGARDSWKRE